MTVRRRKNGAGAMDVRLAALRDDIEALQQNMKSLVVDTGEVAGDGVHEAVRATENAAQRVLDDVEEWANGQVGSLRGVVREQPFTSCILSMSAGALMGALFLRR